MFERFTDRAQQVVVLAQAEARTLNHDYIGTEHILLGLIREGEGVAAQVLVRLGADLDRVRLQVAELLYPDGPPALEAAPRQLVTGPSAPYMPPVPEKGGLFRDLTAAARDGRLDPVIGREQEIERLVRVLARRVKNTPLLIGEPGVGKTAVVNGLVQRIASGRTIPALAARQAFALDLAAIAATSADGGDAEDWLDSLLTEAGGPRTVILFADDLHADLAGASASRVAAVVRRLLGRADLPLVAAVTVAGYRTCIETDAQFGRSFQPIMIAEPTEAQTVEMLVGLRGRYESHHQVTITDDALTAAAFLAGQYLPGRFRPTKAVDLMDEAASAVRARIQTPVDLVGEGEKLARILRDKEAAMEAEDFERAAWLRDRAKRLTEAISAQEKEQRDPDAIGEVGEDEIAETLDVMSGGILPEPGPAAESAAVGPVGDDPEVWSMA
ncbi:MAG TPA: Clp protease N-terminal domain-containing protein [Streptosporangiaceae bacterium]|jgi:ATP-dependent Clp protease ATP-binding subunit ClpC